MDWKIFKTRGLYIAAIFTLIASLAGKYLAMLPGIKIIGAMVIALLIGMLYQLIPGVKNITSTGVPFISNKILRLGIILLGFKLNLLVLMESGIKTIGIAIVVVTVTIVLTYNLAKKFGVNDELALLAASGCGVCGAAAVMGVSPQVKAKSDDSVLAVAVVCILGTVFTLIEVFAQPILGLTDVQFGILNGASLHEIAHAVAAAGAGTVATQEIAIIMKLSRVLMLAPVALIVGYFYHKKNKVASTHAKLPIPWFMAGFLATSAIGSLLINYMGSSIQPTLKGLESLAYILLGMAMCALGMSVNFKVIKERGHKIFIPCVISSIVLFVLALIMAKVLY